MSEDKVTREEYHTPWWDGLSKERLLGMRKDQPTTYRVTFWGDAPVSEAEIKAALAAAGDDMVATIPTSTQTMDVVAHEVIIDRGTAIFKKIIGLGKEVIAWETVLILSHGEWRRIEAIKYREGK